MLYSHPPLKCSMIFEYFMFWTKHSFSLDIETLLLGLTNAIPYINMVCLSEFTPDIFKVSTIPLFSIGNGSNNSTLFQFATTLAQHHYQFQQSNESDSKNEYYLYYYFHFYPIFCAKHFSCHPWWLSNNFDPTHKTPLFVNFNSYSFWTNNAKNHLCY